MNLTEEPVNVGSSDDQQSISQLATSAEIEQAPSTQDASPLILVRNLAPQLATGITGIHGRQLTGTKVAIESFNISQVAFELFLRSDS